MNGSQTIEVNDQRLGEQLLPLISGNRRLKIRLKVAEKFVESAM